MRYAVGIPTRNREVVLNATIEALFHQTIPPDEIIVIDNNDEPREHTDRLSSGAIVFFSSCAFRTTGPEQGHQTALLLAELQKFDVMVRWDDDLVPELDCLEKLIRPVYEKKCVACGGMYPRPDSKKQSSEAGSPDGDDRHIQFFGWDGPDKIIERRHLYSSFAYDVRTALRVGGFPIGYSRFGQRGETDMTLRLAQEGRLLVDTSAVAVHHWAPGGRRSTEDEMNVLSALDSDLFRRRMIEYKIDPENW